MAEVTFRGLQGEADYSLILSTYLKSNQADQVIDPATLDDMKRWCAPSARFDPDHDILFAVSDNEGGEPCVIGFSCQSWYTGFNHTRLYTQASYLQPGWRKPGFWPAMVRQSERRLREIAASHPVTPQRFYQAWATSTQLPPIKLRLH